MDKMEKASISREFAEIWEIWKQYKKEQFRFNYKSISEKGALTHLKEVSNGDEQTAIKIIQQSISNGWKGFFELKINYNGNGQTVTGSKQAGAYQLLETLRSGADGTGK